MLNKRILTLVSVVIAIALLFSGCCPEICPIIPDCVCPECPDCVCPDCPDCVCPECPDCDCPDCPDCVCPDCPDCVCPDDTCPDCPDCDCPDCVCPDCPDCDCPDCPDCDCPDCPDCPDCVCPEEGLPVISLFETDPDTIYKGEISHLNWLVIGADVVLITPDIGYVEVAGSREIDADDMPLGVTTYTLKAINSVGTNTATTTITVNPILLGELVAEDFGWAEFSLVIGYTAGFGLVDATFEDAQVVMRLYAGTQLLQTNTLISGNDLTGWVQISSPFDVFGTFDYVADGYWINVREVEYGQTMDATKVIATVTLNNSKVVTAENTNPANMP